MAKPLPLLVGVLGIGATATGGVILMNRNGSGEGNGTAAPSNTATTPVTEGGGPSGGANVEGQSGAAGGAQTGTAQSGQTGNGAAGAGGSPGAAGGEQAAGGGQGQNTQGQAQQAQQPAVTDLIFEDVSKFKSEALNKSDCLKRDFQGLSLGGESGAEFADNAPASGTFFKTDGEGAVTATKSCLIINWKKSHDASKKKWSGKFTWLWTFQREKEGFITFNVMEPAEAEGKVKFTGVFYLVEKKADEDKWEVKVKKEVTTATTEVDKDSLDGYFPKAGDGLKAAPHNQKDYWDLIDGKDKLGELCKTADSCNGEVKVTELQWTAATTKDGGTDDKLLKDWTSGLTWWEKIYEGAKDKWDFSEKIQNFKGKWTPKSSVPQESQ